MPPKKRGHNARGRDKIFRNAVQHVHVGIGHNVLGAVNMQPTIGVADGNAQSPESEDCAFLVELNEQMLSHSTTDFKSFRWEVLDLCSTRALFQSNHRKIAEKLLLALLNRDKFAEGFEAFARLTVAFARDMREKFFTYFECFHQAVNGGIFDANGHLFADTRRLQLIFSAQAAWCREMRPFWLQPSQRKLVELIIQLYTHQMHDSKEYIRRLAAEVLASTCRMTRELLPLVLEIACADVVRDFEEYCTTSACKKGCGLVDGDDSANSEEEEYGNDGTSAVLNNEEDPVVPCSGAMNLEDLLMLYQKERLPFLPVVDSLCFFVAEVLRGIRGSLNTNFENYYAILVYTFGLTKRTLFEGCCSAGHGINEQELFGFTAEEAQGFVHYTRWKEFLGESEDGAGDGGELSSELHNSGRATVLKELVQMIGSTSVGTALRIISEETAAHFATSSSINDERYCVEDTSDEKGSQSPSLRMLETVVATLEFTAPYVQLMQQLLHTRCFSLLWRSTSLPTIERMVSLLRSTLMHEKEALSGSHTAICGQSVVSWSRLLRSCGAALELFAPLCLDSESAHCSHMVKLHRVCMPLCRDVVSTCVAVGYSGGGDGTSCCSETLFAPKLREATRLLLFAFVQDVLQKNYALSLRQERDIHEDDNWNADGMTSTTVGRSGVGRVRSHLTPFAFALFAPVLHASCRASNASLSRLGSSDELKSALQADAAFTSKELTAYDDTTHALMIIGMMCDRTRNTLVSPLHTLLTMTSGSSFQGDFRRDGNVNDNTLGEHSALLKDLQNLLLGAAALFTSTQGTAESRSAREKASKWADVLIAILPVALVVDEAERAVVRQGKGNGSADSGALFGLRFRDTLLQALSTVKLAVCEGSSSVFGRIAASSFALFAQASALLMHFAPLCSGPGSDNDCMGFIKDAITVLAAGFEERRVMVLGDGEVGRLLHGVECLLHAMLRLFGVEEGLAANGEATVTVPAGKRSRKSQVEQRQQQTQHKALVSVMVRLHDTLDSKSQYNLVQILLFEALVSPIQSLRIVALRLLRLFCHPDAASEHRMCGCSSIETSFFDSLLRAELFNPLSSSGNLDGIQQALAKLSFDTASGALRHPMMRVILARAMMGLLHTKYSVAWPVALRILADLVKIEDTTINGSDSNKGRRGDGEHHLYDIEGTVDSNNLLEPLVWKTVVSRYTRTIVFGDIVRNDSTISHGYESEENSSTEHLGGETSLQRSHSPIWYRIQLTDMQRHEKGELVSKDFSTAQYKSSTVTWLLLVNEDGEVLTWEGHYIPATTPMYTHGKAAAARATDRGVLAKTFLSGLLEMARRGGGLLTDARASLVAELTVELSAIRRGEHPCGTRHVKMLDERFILALNACAAVATSGSTDVESSTGLPHQTEGETIHLGERLRCICEGLISDSNAKLQRAAIDLLRRLKVAPFAQYHQQLVPFCDTQQNLFNFLAGFHVESDMPQGHRADYIAAALAIALPRLTKYVSRDKVKDQAILRRRLLAFVTHITDAKEFTVVLNGLVQRLVAEHVATTKRIGKGMFCFSDLWGEWVAEQTHCTRRLERLLRQLLSATKLLTAVLQAVGKGFSSFADNCLIFGMNVYLVSCKQTVLAPLGETCLAADSDTTPGGGAQDEVKRRVKNVLNSSSLKALMARVRRGAAVLVVSLFEQFPEEAMRIVRDDANMTSDSTGNISVELSLIGRYVSALQANSESAVAEFIGDNQRTAATPFMRLVRAWITSTYTLSLVGTFAKFVTNMFKQLFVANSTVPSNTSGGYGGSLNVARKAQQQTTTLALYESLRCVADILNAGEEQIVILGSAKRSTIKAMFIEPHATEIFTSLYVLIRRGVSCGRREAGFGSPVSCSTGGRPGAAVMSFSVSMWKELIATVSMLTEYVVLEERQSGKIHKSSERREHEVLEDTNTMLSRLLEMCIAFVAHPASVKDRETCVAAVRALESLLPHVHRINITSHYESVVRLFNAVTNPEARLLLCRTLRIMLSQMVGTSSALAPVDFVPGEDPASASDGVKRGSGGYAAQLAAVGRAVSCMNSFADDNTSLDCYDFDLRFHTLRVLRHFFHYDGDYGLIADKKRGRAQRDRLREERDYSGDLDVKVTLHEVEAPVLCVEGFLVLAANAAFFLRDPEGTISVLAVQLVEAMIRYASRQNTRVDGYSTLILNRVVRQIIIPSLRRGVVARNVHTRNAHMQVFGALAQYYGESFRSYAALYDRNVELNFFANVGHLQHRCRLNALIQLRRNVQQLHPREALRVFIPFLLAAVKDFAQGKRDLQNLTEGRAKGYCEAVLSTVAAIAGVLPWEGYYRLLSLLLLNAQQNASLRLPMLRGAVMVLDHFHFLDEDVNVLGDAKNDSEGDSGMCGDRGGDKGAEKPHPVENDGLDDEDSADEDDDEAAKVAKAELRAKRAKYRNTRILHVMEDDILPQLYGFLSGGNRKRGLPEGASDANVGAHCVTSVRGEMRKADGAQQNTSIVQLPVAIAITKIVKRFPHDKFSLHTEQLLDEVALKLRTKNDKQRERARRVLCAMMCEIGPGKLRLVITKLRDHLVHGYQLHVLGYTVVTLLYNLYEPRHSLSYGGKKVSRRAGRRNATANTHQCNEKGEETGDGLKGHQRDGRKEGSTSGVRGQSKRCDDGTALDNPDEEEEELLRMITPTAVQFDYAYGVSCLTACLDDIMTILLDDYLGEVSEQKQQVELMSTMLEVKSSRALQGFVLIASHCQATCVIETFLQKITWLLTPPGDTTNVDVDAVRGGARAGALLLLRELKTKYSTVSKNATADFAFVQKVRLLALRVARALLKNPTMEVESSFRVVCSLLHRHNETREQKIKAFEAKEGIRRIRGSSQPIERRTSAAVPTRLELLDANFLVAPRPERVDVDFSAHTVLATQQKQKLRAYRGRYGKEVQRAAKHFYREDPTAAVVLDTLDEFLLKHLLSVLKQVLGMGGGRKSSNVVLRLDLLRSKNRSKIQESHNEGDINPTKESNEREDHDSSSVSSDDIQLDPKDLDDGEGDELDQFADEVEQNDDKEKLDGGRKVSGKMHSQSERKERRDRADLAVSFTRHYQQLLEDLVPVVLATLHGEGSDAVVGYALDCMLALLSLRPPLQVVGVCHASLYNTVTAFFERGGAVKQRAMRVAASVISHQRFILTEAQASQITSLCHAELVERSRYAPMALALFHAVLGRHVHVVEVYDLIGLVTELLLHASAKRLMRQRCIFVITRFLTEYRMTPEKFRSHMDLLYRNMDYPEVTGRIALLELFITLINRLPTVVLRQEAPLLLLPLTVTLSCSEFIEARHKAGTALQCLVRYAGVDTVVPTLSKWLGKDRTRRQKAVALQAWALMLSAIASAFGYDEKSPEGTVSPIEEFTACYAWSLPSIVSAATYDQMSASRVVRRSDEFCGATRRKMEMKGWAYVFFGLRCVEVIAAAVPLLFWHDVSLAKPLVSRLSSRLILHTHPWVQSVSLRLLRMYCTSGVETLCSYLVDNDWASVRFAVTEEETVGAKRKHCGKDANQERTDEDSAERGATPPSAAAVEGSLPYVVVFRGSGPLDSSGRAEAALGEISSTLRLLLLSFARSDVSNEKYVAHRAIARPSRSDAVGLTLYLIRSMAAISMALLVNATALNTGGRLSHTRKFVARYFTSLRRQFCSIAAPAISNESVTNVMVRTASLVQCFGGLIAAIPRVGRCGYTIGHDDGRNTSDAGGDGEAQGPFDVRNVAGWLLRNAVELTFIQQTVVPTIVVAMRCGKRSEKLSTLATQASSVLREQLESRRRDYESHKELEDCEGVTTKRQLTEKGRGVRKRCSSEEGDVSNHNRDYRGPITVDDPIFALTTAVEELKNVRKDEVVRRDTAKVLRKRARSASGDFTNQHKRVRTSKK